MAYNYGPPPGAQPNGAPHFPPPGFSAPPGLDPSQFAMPNMPNINLNAPVIRLGVGPDRPDRNGPPRRDDNRRGPSDRGGDNRNLDRERQALRENMMAMQPPTREEVARTIFVGNLQSNGPRDEELEGLLACAGKLRRWTRARDERERECGFGFAEFEDVESLEAAAEIFTEVEVPLFGADGAVKREIKEEDAEGESGEVKKSKLNVVVDEASLKYIDEWKGKRRESDDQRAFRIESCKEEVRNVLAMMANSSAHRSNGRRADRDGDTEMGENAVEILHLPNNIDDELADIPGEHRATVAEEIKAFRDRSHRRDLERTTDRDQEDDRNRRRGASPGAGVNGSSSNNIPVGPRGVQGAPSGPKGFRGAQIPSDYVNGVSFVGQNGAYVPIRDDEDAEESDEELERRHQARKKEDLDQSFTDHIRRWQNRERTRGAAQERERKREEDEKRNLSKAREDMLARLANWNDEEERRHPYHKDPSSWSRSRAYALEREKRDDDDDRRAEEREREEERFREAEARGQAGDFLSNMMDVDTSSRPSAPQADQGGRVKISLGTAKAKTAAAAPAKRAMVDVEGLLDDEEDAATSGAKQQLSLKPLQDTSTLPTSGADLTDDEKAAARRQLAAEIPAEKEALYAHPIRWDMLTKELVEEQIRPFVERKVLELLGMQERFLVDQILEGVRERVGPEELERDVEGALDEEAGVMVRKVWRLLVFWGECEGRGLSA